MTAVAPRPHDTGDPDAPDPGDDLRSRARARRELDLSVQDGPDPAATDRQHDRGKLTVRERLELLFDPGTFVEIEPLRRHRASAFGMDANRPYTDGVVAGWGKVEGRTVYAYGHDFRIFGGALGESHAEKIHKTMDLAISTGSPLVGISDGAGARIQEGVTALAGYGGIFRRNTAASGVIPQISVVLGPCAGGAAYSPALTDVVFMVRGTAQMFVTGPDVVATVTGERVPIDELGGAGVHGSRSGVASFVHEDEASCFDDVRLLLSMLPANNRSGPPVERVGDPPERRCEALYDIVSTDPAQAYDVRDVITEVTDDASMLEIHEGWAPNIVCAFARLDGHVVGIVANQPSVLAGTMDIDASDKAARFVQTCDAFSIPIVTMLDVPGFLPGSEQEHRGIIRHGAKLLYAYCAATVPRVQVILRKAYGGAYIVLDSRSIGADLSFAWPSNEVAVMGAEGAAGIIFRREIAGSPDPEGTRAARIEDYRDELLHPYYAAERGLVDDVIDPADTRRVLVGALDALRSKHAETPVRKHGNPPQ
ncbi:acyl-CoA carboxylase subunit beta [Pseudonocardia endophytica]|uniref:Acetyl-CoA carboxylase carboxyltransferase component n=1 Tax=Pseudonocardia endophytica TaxID=401976 RepID=A0A4R1HXD5_PSEEN|nr:acyl-CoA carboxylase subunit beta [Pseudonocardia endophytica]TCK22202.1 acetyl-CoA carboxylase carboxyltransferase component [Pseudonocardia endophytica]